MYRYSYSTYARVQQLEILFYQLASETNGKITEFSKRAHTAVKLKKKVIVTERRVNNAGGSVPRTMKRYGVEKLLRRNTDREPHAFVSEKLTITTRHGNIVMKDPMWAVLAIGPVRCTYKLQDVTWTAVVDLSQECGDAIVMFRYRKLLLLLNFFLGRLAEFSAR